MIKNYDNRSDYSRYRVTGYPVRHRRKVPFEPTLCLDNGYRNIIRAIRAMDSELDRFILSSDEYLNLVSDAYSTNIHWSVKIEGNKLTQEEVRSLVDNGTSGHLSEKPSGPQQEILNHLYSFYMKSIFDLPWSVDTILRTHYLLMCGVNNDLMPGKIRDREVSVTDGTGFEYFLACPVEHIQTELESLVDWLNYSPYDELVSSVLFFHEFESIHPFSDGNGRTGRTLFQILIQTFGLKNAKLCKFEKELLTDTGTYYDLLAYVDQVGDYRPLVMYFAEALLRAYSEAVKSFSDKDLLKDMDMNSRCLAIMARQTKEFDLNEASGWIPTLSQQSVRNKLNDMVDAGLLERMGRTKGLRYRFIDPLRKLKEVHTIAESEGFIVETVDDVPLE